MTILISVVLIAVGAWAVYNGWVAITLGVAGLISSLSKIFKRG